MVDAGGGFKCGLRLNGSVECWGAGGFYGEQDVPAGPFTYVGVGATHACALSDSGEISCWGQDSENYGLLDAPAGSFKALDVGFLANCALT